MLPPPLVRSRRPRGRAAAALLAAVVAALSCALAGNRAAGARPAVTVTFHAGWSLVAAPDGARFAGADGAIYTLQPGDDGYEALPPDTSAAAGEGYWVYFPTARTLALDGGVAYVALTLPPGQWVLIGNPSGDRTLPVAGADAVFTYDPLRGYRYAAQLQPGQGAWAYSAEGGPASIGLRGSGQ